MKKYEYSEYFDGMDYESTFYIGEASEIKSLYKALLRNEHHNLIPTFINFPIFNENKYYALEINHNINRFSIVNSDTMLRLIVKDL